MASTGTNCHSLPSAPFIACRGPRSPGKQSASGNAAATAAAGPAAPKADALPAGFENEQMVWEMMYNPSYKLPTDEAESSWRRALVAGTEADEVNKL